MLTATVWGYFASLQSYGAIAGSQAEVIDLPALQYGLLHAQVQPRKPFGLVTTGISFKGLNMDIGHVRSIRWVKDDDPNSPINNKPELTQNGKTAAQNRWIAYNKAKGQYSSAQEHATPEAFWVDKNQCRYMDSNGQVQNPTMQPCAEGISAVKAIAIAQQQGQKIYTINENNRDTALPKLPIGGEVGAEIRNAIQAGKEVTFHEARIHEHGWSGYGYSIVDPETGAGAYLIEGKGNGGWFSLVALAAVALFLLFGIIGSLALGGLIASIALLPFYTLAIGALALLSSLLADNNGGFDYDCGGISTCDSSDYIVMILAAASSIALITSGSILGVVVGILLFVSFIRGKYVPNP
ncbi:hypothetical protein CLI93_00540 [Vandammella animalimorsus]|nr:hypothetical protein CK626_04220 [Vandammella animalimorsus]PAX20289.1 hypothetical protein CLI93_00540 [Vandammella animalimorsus]